MSGEREERGLSIATGSHDEGEEMAEQLHMEESTEYSHDSSGYIMEQDRFLPIANVSRIMKRVIPPSGKIAKDAKECCQECVSEFISFITSEASERCQHEKRKTINGEDLLFAMSNLGFDNYIEPLKLYLQRFREAQKGDKGPTSGAPPQNMSAIKDSADPFATLLGNLGVSTPQPTTTTTQPIGSQQQHITIQVTGAGGQPQQIQVPVVYAMDSNAANPTVLPSGSNYVTIQTPQGMQLIQLVASNTASGIEEQGDD